MTSLSPPLRRLPVDPTPVLLAAALAIGLAVQFALPSPSALTDTDTALFARRGARLPVVAGPVRLASSAAYPAILDRPLFSPGRSGAGLDNAAALGALALLGVASDGGRASATLAAAGGAPQTLRLGEVFQGWRLSGVERDHALLSRGAVVQVLKVGQPPQGPASAPLAAGPGVPPR